MKESEEHSFACVKCHEPLFSSKQNEWIRVGRRHLMPRTDTILRGHEQLLLEDDRVSGKQELAACELQRLQCGNCRAQVALRCNDAPKAKQNFIGKLFLRQDAIEVYGPTTTSSPSVSPRMHAKQCIQFRVVDDPDLSSHITAEPSAASSISGAAASQPSDRPVQDQVDGIRPEQLQAVLDEQAKLIAEVKALRKLAAANQQFLRTQLDKFSSAHHSESESIDLASHEVESMDIDSPVRPPEPEPVTVPFEHSQNQNTQNNIRFSAPPVEPPAASYSDSDYEPTQPLKDHPLHQPITRNLHKGEGNRNGARNGSSDLRRTTLEDLHRFQDETRQNPIPFRRGPRLRGFSSVRAKMSPSTSKGKAPERNEPGSAVRDENGNLIRRGPLRRGVSGGRAKMSPSTPKGKAPERNEPGSAVRDENGNLITSTGKIDGRSLRHKKKRLAEQGYKSSPLAAGLSLDSLASSDSHSAVRSDDMSNGGSTASVADALMTRAATASSGDGVARSHEDIMKLVNKGMKAQMGKSRLERGYARLPKPSI